MVAVWGGGESWAEKMSCGVRRDLWTMIVPRYSNLYGLHIAISARISLFLPRRRRVTHTVAWPKQESALVARFFFSPRCDI